MTIRELAKSLGLSAAAVSRILNDDKTFSVAYATRQRVLEAAEKNGYNASRQTKNRKTIICVNNTVPGGMQSDSYFDTILSGINHELTKNQYQMELFDLNALNQGAEVPPVFPDYATGAILFTLPDERIMRSLKAQTQNIVCVDTSLIGFDNIRYNRFEAGCKAMELLIKRGHRKIAFVGSRIPFKFSAQFGRYDAYQTMMHRYFLTINHNWILDSQWDRNLCFNLVKNLMKLKDRPTAIFFASDYMAIASLPAITGEGLRVPDDVSIIGISDIDEAKTLSPPLTTVSIPQFDMGQIAAATLLNRINGDKTPPKQIYVPTKLILRKTVKRYSNSGGSR